MRIEDMPHYLGYTFVERPWTTREVAEYLGIPLRRVYECVRMGEIKPAKRGGKLFFNPEEIRRYEQLIV